MPQDYLCGTAVGTALSFARRALSPIAPDRNYCVIAMQV
jgi:hypothetical protein